MIFFIKEIPRIIDKLEDHFLDKDTFKEYLMVMRRDPDFTVPDYPRLKQYQKEYQEYTKILSNKADFRSKLTTCPINIIQVVTQ